MRDWKNIQYLENGWVVLNGTALSKENDQMSLSLGQNTFDRNNDVFYSGLFVKLVTTVPLGTTRLFYSDRFFPTAMVKTPLASEDSYNISIQRSKVIWKISNLF